MKRIHILSLFLLLPALIFAQGIPKQVTFNVDMTGYSGTYTEVNLNGDFNGWCGGCAVMDDSNNDDIFTITIPIDADSIEYKFTVDGWTDQENFIGGESCTKTTISPPNTFVNRFAQIPSDTVLEVVCWNSCTSCDSIAPPTSHDVTFAVDMTNYIAAGNTFTAVEVNGTWNSWCGGCQPLSDPDGDNIWTGTYTVPIGLQEFKYAVDAWADDEQLIIGDPCTMTSGAFTNRALDVTSDTTLATVCWGSCVSCDQAPEPGNVTLRVNMTQFPDPFTTVYVSGTFNSWCGNCDALSDPNSDGTWETTLQLGGGAQQFKFTLDDWAVQEEFDSTETCTFTDGGFTNRIVEVNGDTILPIYCFNSCEACAIPLALSNIDVTHINCFGETGSLTANVIGGTPPYMYMWSNGDTTATSSGLPTGNYTVMIIDAAGDTVASDANGVDIMGPSAPLELLLEVPSQLDTIDLTVSGGTPPYSYLWDSGSTDEDIPTLPGPFIYTVVVTDANGCTSTDSIAVNPIGIDPIESLLGLNLYPNPAKNILNIEAEFNRLESIQISILSIEGQVLYQTISQSDRVDLEIDLQDFSNGIYMLQLQSLEGRAIRRLIIAK